jgi:hypothetical protein
MDGGALYTPSQSTFNEKKLPRDGKRLKKLGLLSRESFVFETGLWE